MVATARPSRSVSRISTSRERPHDPFVGAGLLEAGTMVSVDEGLCTGCQVCAATAPETFEMDGGLAVAVDDEVTADVEQAKDQCPVDAISL